MVEAVAGETPEWFEEEASEQFGVRVLNPAYLAGSLERLLLKWIAYPGENDLVGGGLVKTNAEGHGRTLEGPFGAAT